MIGLIGSYCDDRESASGQAVRTTFLYNALCQRYGLKEIYKVNTHGFRNKPLKVLLNTLACIIYCKDIIVMVHENGMKFYFPILSFVSKCFGKNIYHNVIGGRFKEYLIDNPKLIKNVKTFKVNWVQMQSQIDNLKEIGVTNTELLPNTKSIEILSEKALYEYSEEVFRFCMCSRISIAKGVEEAIKAIETINQRSNRVIVKLDIYGKPDSGYEERFSSIIEHCSSAIRYCGFIPNNKTIEQLKGYYMLLFPSTYEGEGFPGTVWDAFGAGLPIIATNWRYNSEVIEHGTTGLIYDYKNPEGLIDQINYSINHVDEINKMRVECIKYIKAFSPDLVFPIIYKYFD